MAKNETSNVGQRQTDASFTLTEVVVAAVLMLLSLSLLLSGFGSSKRSIALAGHYARSHNVAHQSGHANSLFASQG